jgi:predicted nucleic acid-binding protein
LCCEDETTPASEEILDWAIRGSELYVPSVWGWEILNVVAVTVKRKRITADRARDFLAQLATLNFKTDNAPAVTDFSRLQAMAERYELTSYDVSYLDLAKRLALPLATLDGDLREAAFAERIELLGA